MRTPGLHLCICATRTLATVGPIATRAGAPHVHTLNDDQSGSLLDAVAALAPDFTTVERNADDPAAILYTSGTTGRSKGAVLSHGNLAANARVLHDAWRWQPGDVLLHVLPIYHAHGLFIAAHGALFAGAKMIWLARFETRQVAGLLPRSTVMMGVPTHYVRLLAEPALDRASCRNMRVFISGSAPLAAETFGAFRERTGHALLERYGMTETLILVSHAGDARSHPRIAGTVGLPLPEVELRIVDDTGQVCAVGEIGEIQVRGPSVFQGYWGKPPRSEEDFTHDGWLRTGDLGRWGGAGGAIPIPDQYVSIVGRRKDLIISGGFNIYAKEVEDVIGEFSGVADCAVIGAPHPDFGEAVVAVVVPSVGTQLNAADLQAGLKLRIASFKVPKRIHFTTELPRNAMGKVQKNVLRRLYGEPVATTTVPNPAPENAAGLQSPPLRM